MPTIRTAKRDDASTIVDFNCRLAEESEGLILNRETVAKGVAALLTDPNKGTYYLACDGDQIMGQLMITKEWSDWRHGWLWWIQSVYVRAEARRRGVFRALYQHVIDTAQEADDVVGFRLYVEKDNRVGQATYEGVGMSPTNYLVYEHMVR